MRTLMHWTLATVVMLSVTGVEAQVIIGSDPIDPCAIRSGPQPTGVSQDFLEQIYGGLDLNFPSLLHSSTHLQGNPAAQKFAASVFYEPDTAATGLPSEFANFRTAIVVNNPDPNSGVQVRIDYFDFNGNLVGSSGPFGIGGEGTYTEQASILQNSWGSAEVTVIGEGEIVGTTIHHGPDLGTNFPEPNFPFPLGVTSSQQLQVKQETANLWFGPIPIANDTSLDLLNGLLPGYAIRNTSPGSIDATSHLIVREIGGPVTVQSSTVTIPQNGVSFSTGLWNQTLLDYLMGGGTQKSIFVVVNAVNTPTNPQSTTPPSIVGEAFLADPFGDNFTDNLTAGGVLRMSSMMMSHTRTDTLVNPDFTYLDSSSGPTNNPDIVTVMGVQNITNKDRGDLRVEYRDKVGTVVGVDTIPLTPRRAVLLGPGLPDSPNYPTTDILAGSVRMTSCEKGIIGWTMRYAVSFPYNPERDAWGEVLDGSTGAEPGNGETFTLPNNDAVYSVLGHNPFADGPLMIRRKVASLQRTPEFLLPGTDFLVPYPGYIEYANYDTSNVGEHFIRLFLENGIDSTDYLFAAQPLDGLAAKRTGFTNVERFYDGVATRRVCGYVDALDLSSKVRGISVIGAPMEDWCIGFSDSEVFCD